MICEHLKRHFAKECEYHRIKETDEQQEAVNGLPVCEIRYKGRDRKDKSKNKSKAGNDNDITYKFCSRYFLAEDESGLEHERYDILVSAGEYQGLNIR